MRNRISSNAATVLLALREAQYTERNMSHEEARAAIVEALAMMPCSSPELGVLRKRLCDFHEEFSREENSRHSSSIVPSTCLDSSSISR